MNLDFHNIDKFCKDVDSSANILTMDFTDLDFISPFALVYLGLFIRNRKDKGNFFEYRAPEKCNVREYLEQQGFFRRFKIPILDSTPEEFLYSIPMIDIKSDPGLPDEYSEKLKRLLIDLRVGTDIGEFCEVAAEILDNFIFHSEDRFGLIAFQWYPNRRELQIAFGDLGIGFKNSLSKNPSYRYLLKKPSAFSIAMAVTEGVSRFKERRGSGLSLLIEYVIRKKGELYITSDDGYFFLDSRMKPVLGDKSFNLPGVQIGFKIPEDV